MIQNAQYKLAVQVYIWSDVDPKDSSTFLKLCMAMEFFFPFFKDLIFFISSAVAANGGLLEEVVVVWSGGSDTGVSFITVGHCVWVLMEIIMHVHNAHRHRGSILSACQTPWSFFAVITITSSSHWGVTFVEFDHLWTDSI